MVGSEVPHVTRTGTPTFFHSNGEIQLANLLEVGVRDAESVHIPAAVGVVDDRTGFRTQDLVRIFTVAEATDHGIQLWVSRSLMAIRIRAEVMWIDV